MFILSYFGKKVPLETVLGVMASVAHFITGHEQTRLNRVCYFRFFRYSLLPKDPTFQNLFHCIQLFLICYFLVVLFLTEIPIICMKQHGAG